MTKRAVILLATLSWVSQAAAAPTPWMFDFDPNLPHDQAYVNQHMNTLKAGLPGVPPGDGIAEVSSRQIKLYFYQDVIDALLRARNSGPGNAPTVTRTPQRCVQHFSFVKPSLLLDSPPFLCDLHENNVMAAFDAAKIKTCGYVEFPESYVYDHTPLAMIFPPTTADIDVLMAILGDALTQLIYPTGLLPADLLPQARSIIAKLRYTKLKDDLTARKQEYQRALSELQANMHCYKVDAVAAFTSQVNALMGELNAVGQDLDALYSAGVAQAIADRKALEARGRMRADLPYPALTDRERELLAFYLGGLSWRVRGSGLINEDKIPLGTTLTFVPSTYQLIADITGGADGKDVGFPIYVNENAGYAEWWDMGQQPGNDEYADLVQMTNRGKGATTLVAPLLQGRGFDTRHLLAGGLMMGACYYYITWEIPDFFLGPPCEPGKYSSVYEPNMPGCLGEPDYMQFLEWPTATSEFCTGAALALGLTKTLLYGKPGQACTPDCHGKPCGADDTCGGTCAICNDGGVAVIPDSSVPPVGDGGVSAADKGPTTPTNDAGQVPTPPSDGCSIASEPAGPMTALLLLFVGLALRRRSS